MSEIHEFKCDKCQKRVAAKYNGEHWLPPVNWIRAYDDASGTVLNWHLCPKCVGKLSLSIKSEPKGE